MTRIIVAGIGTGVGKTLVSAILVTALQADYWKPIQCGDLEHSDTKSVQNLITSTNSDLYPPIYQFKAPLSPHHAARLENRQIDRSELKIPQTKRPLVIESVGGVLVPLNDALLSLDLFQAWEAKWIVVSRHYLGSINHTLLTLEALKARRIPVHAIVFNGASNVDSEKVILGVSKLPCLGRINPEQEISKTTIKTYADRWKPTLDLFQLLT